MPDEATKPAYTKPLPDLRPEGERFWEGTREHKLVVQRCGGCRTWRWGPEWICYACHSFDTRWEEVAPEGVIYSWERPWHPVHRALAEACPYVVLLVELPHAGGIRMIGNLVGDPLQPFAIGDRVTAVFEDHPDGDPPFTLVQWAKV